MPFFRQLNTIEEQNEAMSDDGQGQLDFGEVVLCFLPPSYELKEKKKIKARE